MPTENWTHYPPHHFDFLNSFSSETPGAMAGEFLQRNFLPGMFPFLAIQRQKIEGGGKILSKIQQIKSGFFKPFPFSFIFPIQENVVTFHPLWELSY
jgi:hypothetical protein